MHVDPLDEFLKTAYKLDLDDFKMLVDQAIVLLGQLYVHLPQKRATRGIDPVQRLRLLRYHLPKLTPREFHDEMLAIFADLHDFHTGFLLPAPFAGKAAMLPFVVEECYEDKQRKYLVTRILKGFEDATFQPGVEVTRWNGVPIDRALEIIGRRHRGTNLEAQRANAVLFLTVRTMTQVPPPDELSVTLHYRSADGKDHDRVFDWFVGEPPTILLPPSPKADAAEAAAISESMGIDFDAETVRRVRKALFVPEAMEQEREAALRPSAALTSAVPEVPAPAAPPKGVSTLPDAFTYRTVSVNDREFGYLRIWTFQVDDQTAFFEEARRILKDEMPPTGLIIDVRGNGGGVIMNAERLLQLLTPGPIEPEREQFISTPATQRLVRFNPSMMSWIPSIDESLESGAVYSAGFPLTSPVLANNHGQLYQGPIVLIVDGLCYSTTDVFAAGFQDSGVGKILGLHRRTGGGGGNVWKYSDILQNCAGDPAGISVMPKGSSFRIAVRRNIRPRKSDRLVEEFGVEADEVYQMTREDILDKDHPNQHLINRAGEMLAQETVRSLKGELKPGPEGQVTVAATFSNIHRIDVFVHLIDPTIQPVDVNRDTRPGGSFPVLGASAELTIPVPSAGSLVIELRGYDTVTVNDKPIEKLVVATRIPVPDPNSHPA